MKTITLILAILFLTACGKSEYQEHRAFGGIDPEFESYLDEINELALKNTGKTIDFSGLALNFSSDVSMNREAECFKAGGDIYVNPGIWKALGENKRVALILHEIGHCVFKRPHDDTRLPGYKDGSYPNSIMATRDAVKDHMFKELKDHFIIELLGE